MDSIVLILVTHNLDINIVPLNVCTFFREDFPTFHKIYKVMSDQTVPRIPSEVESRLD